MRSTYNYEAIRPRGPRFRELPIERAFTWEDGLTEETEEGGIYVVAFRSQRNLQAEPAKIDRLLELDDAAFEEAQQSDGFRVYQHDDELSPEGVGLSFCAWDSMQHAREASHQPRHLEAVRFVLGEEGSDVYINYEVQGYAVEVSASGLVFQAAQMLMTTAREAA